MRRPYVDGIRGAAALYVVLYHAWAQVAMRTGAPPLSGMVRTATEGLAWGQLAVDVFIVLSGYCLMLPVVERGKLSGGLTGYFQRRAGRILPPYFAALVFGSVVLLVPGMGQIRGVTWDQAVPPTLWMAWGQHALMLHNLRSHWMYLINPPLWTVATESQIYVLFPLLLLPLWCRVGPVIAIPCAFALGIMPSHLGWAPTQASHWFFGLFALGMLAAQLGHRSEASSRLAGWVAAISAGIVVIGLRLRPEWLIAHLYVLDAIAGFSAAALLVHCARTPATESSRALKLVELPWLTRVGDFSYSLYLIHFPVLALLHLYLLRLPLSPAATLAVMLSGGSALSLGCAWLFYQVCEKRFLPRPAGSGDQPPVRKSNNPE